MDKPVAVPGEEQVVEVGLKPFAVFEAQVFCGKAYTNDGVLGSGGFASDDEVAHRESVLHIGLGVFVYAVGFGCEVFERECGQDGGGVELPIRVVEVHSGLGHTAGETVQAQQSLGAVGRLKPHEFPRAGRCEADVQVVVCFAFEIGIFAKACFAFGRHFVVVEVEHIKPGVDLKQWKFRHWGDHKQTVYEAGLCLCRVV